MENGRRKFLNTILTILCFSCFILGIALPLFSGVMQIIIQIREFGYFVKFIILPHWSLWCLFGILLFIPGTALLNVI